MNNCPHCIKEITELKLSLIKGVDEVLPRFDCATLCCPFCGVILMAMPDLGSVSALLKLPATVQ